MCVHACDMPSGLDAQPPCDAGTRRRSTLASTWEAQHGVNTFFCTGKGQACVSGGVFIEIVQTCKDMAAHGPYMRRVSLWLTHSAMSTDS